MMGAKSSLAWAVNRPGVAIVIVAILSLLNCFQGVEMTDEGFWGCFYQQVFVAPQSVQYNFLYWFTGVVGGIWNALWPLGDLLGFRVLGVMVMCATMCLSALLLKPYVAPRVLSLSLLLVGFLQHSAPNIFYEKNWCGFLAVCMAFCLHRGLVRRQAGWLFACGVAGAVVSLSRLPSVVMFGLGLSVLYYWSIRAITRRQCLAFVAWFIFGAVAGFGALLGGMIALGQVGIFADALRFMVELASDSTGDVAHHGWKALVILLYVSLLNIATKGMLVGMIVAGAAVCASLVRNRVVRPGLKRAGICAIQAALLLGIHLLARHPWDLVAILTCFSSVVLLIGTSKQVDPDPARRLLFVIALGGVALLPLGSNIILGMMRYALWLAVPLAADGMIRILLCVRCWASTKSIGEPHAVAGYLNSQHVLPELKRMLVVGFVGLVALNARMFWGGVYRDGGGRLNMRTQVQASSARGVYTSSARSGALDELLAALGAYVHAGDELLVFANMPMLHMLTETRPYLGVSWVKVLDPGQLRASLHKAASQSPNLPVVVAHKRNVGLSTWPGTAEPYLTSLHVADRYAALAGFLQAHKYVRLWENTEFLVWGLGLQ